MTSIPYISTATGLSIVVKNRSRTIPRDHANFDDILKAVKAGDLDELLDLIDLKAFVARLTNGLVKIADDEVRVGEQKVPEYLAKRIISDFQNGEDVTSICRMTEKLITNPNKDIVEDLFLWLEKGGMPIAADGDILGFKKVAADYRSIHSGKNGRMLQSVGSVVEMSRFECDENRDRTCSTGLHFCSYSYLHQFGLGGESRIIIVKINPKDITAIPTDYNHTKGRTCRFEVIGEVPEDEAKEFFTTSVVRSFGTYNDDEDFVEDFIEELTTKEDKAAELSDEGFAPELMASAYAAYGSYAGAGRSLGISGKTFKRLWSKTQAGKVEKKEVKAVKAKGLTFERNGVSYNGAAIVKAVKSKGPGAAAKDFGLPRSTLYTWYNRSIQA